MHKCVWKVKYRVKVSHVCAIGGGECKPAARWLVREEAILSGASVEDVLADVRRIARVGQVEEDEDEGVIVTFEEVKTVKVEYLMDVVVP